MVLRGYPATTGLRCPRCRLCLRVHQTYDSRHVLRRLVRSEQALFDMSVILDGSHGRSNRLFCHPHLLVHLVRTQVGHGRTRTRYCIIDHLSLDVPLCDILLHVHPVDQTFYLLANARFIQRLGTVPENLTSIYSNASR